MIKKAAALATTSYLFATSLASRVLAQNNEDIKISVPRPSTGVPANANVGVVIGNALTIIYALGALLVLVFVILGAFSWITSGGDKEKVKSARGQIVNALIGLALLALAALLTNVVARILGFGDVLNFNIPTLGRNAGGQ